MTVKRFCPVERIATLVNSYCREQAKEAYSGLTIRIQQPVFVERSISSNQDDVGMHVGESERRILMNASVIEGEFVFRTISGDIVKPFECNNYLVTDDPLKTNYKYSNDTLVDGTKLCAPEALTTINGVSKFEAKALSPRYADVRPFYQYYLVNAGSKYVLAGPAPQRVFEPMGVIRVGSKVFTVGSLGAKLLDSSKESISVATQEPSSVPRHNTTRIVLVCNGVETTFVLRQRLLSVDGCPILGHSLLEILKIGAFFDLNGEFEDKRIKKVGLTIFLNMERTRNGWTLGCSERQFYDEYVISNQVIQSLSKQLVATEDGILLRDKDGGFGALVSSSSVSCFVLSFAVLLSLSMAGSYSFLLATLDNISKSGFLKATSSGALIGCTSEALKTTKKLYYPSAVGGAQITLQRTTVDVTKAVPGLYLLGYDPKERDLAPGEPDHWIIVNVRDDSKVELIYDPLPTSLPFLADVGDLLHARDAMLVSFDGTCTVASRTKDLQMSMYDGVFG